MTRLEQGSPDVGRSPPQACSIPTSVSANLAPADEGVGMNPSNLRSGYFRVYRSLFESDLWQDPILFRVWMWCLQSAAWKEHRIPVGAEALVLKPGQFAAGRKEAASTIGISEQTFRTKIAYLKSTSRIATESTNRFTLITLCNWRDYQEHKPDRQREDAQPDSHLPTSSQPAANQQPTTTEVKETSKAGEEVKKTTLPSSSDGGVQGQKPTKAKRPKPAPDPRVKKFIGWFAACYLKEFGRKYVVCGGRDGAAAKALIQALDLEGVNIAAVLAAAVKTMFADEFWKNKASLSTLRAQINNFRAGPQAPKAPAARGKVEVNEAADRIVEADT